ncbi:MAG: hypothetical protein FWD71_20220 [Oscillospiraceae bacterium]|nr:hypothetical protein [Oscillospiraceae bacterium]
MKEFNYDVSTARKNPFAERLRKEGHTINIDYKPEYVDIKAKNKKTKSTQKQDLFNHFNRP